MSEWITHRRPTFEDAGSIKMVWTTYNGKVFPLSYDVVPEGAPWMPITPPEPYTVQTANKILADAIEILKKKVSEPADQNQDNYNGVCGYCLRKESNCVCSEYDIDVDFGAK